MPFDLIGTILSGASGGISGKVLELLAGGYFSNEDSSEEANAKQSIISQGNKVVQQVGRQASTPYEIPAALDGFKIKIDENGNSKTYHENTENQKQSTNSIDSEKAE